MYMMQGRRVVAPLPLSLVMVWVAFVVAPSSPSDGTGSVFRTLARLYFEQMYTCATLTSMCRAKPNPEGALLYWSLVARRAPFKIHIQILLLADFILR